MNRLSALVQNSLQFYRPNAVQPTLVDVRKLLDDVVTLIEPQVNEINGTVHKEYAQGAFFVQGIQSPLQQVFLNILLNAVNAMQNSPGKHEIWLNLDRTNGYINMSIEDTGPGLMEEAEQHVFEPFFTTKKDGTGLGLSISYEIIVEIHRGEIRFVKGVHGKGARVLIALPA